MLSMFLEEAQKSNGWFRPIRRVQGNFRTSIKYFSQNKGFSKKTLLNPLP
jgi:hypothetical protein